MGRHKLGKPDGATIITRYDQLEELIGGFVNGQIPLLVIVGNPGLAKSQSVKRGIGGKPHMYVKGRKSPFDFYRELYDYTDAPVVIDDADDVLGNKLSREYIKDLCETDIVKTIRWGSKATGDDIPREFKTRSTCCIIVNYWGDDPIFAAIASRAEFMFFSPDWGEVYKQAADWFQDQEIFDYVYERLGAMKTPDARVLVKAYHRKQGNMQTLDWRAVIDSHCDDEPGLVARRLLRDGRFKTNTNRAAAFTQETGLDRATFYRRKALIETMVPQEQPARIVLAEYRATLRQPLRLRAN